MNILSARIVNNVFDINDLIWIVPNIKYIKYHMLIIQIYLYVYYVCVHCINKTDIWGVI